MAGLRNIDRTDREMLIVIDRCADKEGVVSSQDVADALGIPALNGKSPAGRVSTRLSWMARFGQLERLDPKVWGRKSTEAIWMITSDGHDLLHGKITKAVDDRIRSASSGERVLIMRALSEYGFVNASQFEATAIRRQWEHNRYMRR